jgi:hypothetical protein
MGRWMLEKSYRYRTEVVRTDPWALVGAVDLPRQLGDIPVYDPC